jgi:hypothetical protein
MCCLTNEASTRIQGLLCRLRVCPELLDLPSSKNICTVGPVPENEVGSNKQTEDHQLPVHITWIYPMDDD